MMLDVKKILTLIGLVSVVGVSVNAVQDAPTDENQNGKLVHDYNIYAIPLPMDLDFAGDPVPMDEPDIAERLDRELLVNTYWQSNGLLLIKRANKYFPVIEPILKVYGVPDDFKYVAVIESSLTNA